MYSFYKGILLMYLIYHCSGSLDCGETHLTEPSGYLTSPGFPIGLPQAGSCKWKIVPRSAEYVTVSFEVFHFPNNNNSWLSIGPSRGEGKALFYTGAKPPTEPYISALGDGTISISMVVNKDDIGARFNLTYIRGPMSPSQTCPSHQFQCLNGKCVLSGWRCNNQNECGDSSDEADCPGLPTTPHSTSCPSHHFECISSVTNRLQCFEEIRKCDGHNDCENGDDEESCTTICQYSLVGLSGWFASPNFPENYYDNLDCEWHISLGQEGIVQLRFLFFEVESGFYMDYVKVTEENGGEQEAMIGQYYGSAEGIHSPPTVVESSGNSLMVQFHSDHSLNRRGFNATFQKKGFCIDNQKSCGESDDNCYDVEKEKCDGHYACHRGQDELGCRNCSAGKIPCLLSGDCFLPEDRCNGVMSCSPNNEDEQLCPSEICGESEGLFLCGDSTCIQEKWVCDLQLDCADGSDEFNCEPTIKVVTAAVIGSLVCGMLLVAALSCTCKLYQLRNIRREGRSNSSHSPYYIYRGEHDQREAPPSYSATMASPHYAELQRAFVEGVQGISGSSHQSRGVSRRRSRFLRLISRHNVPSSATSNQELTNDGGTAERRGGGNPDQDGQSPQNEALMERISSEGTDPQNNIETSSLTTSDTDSEANQDAVQQAHLDQQILNAAANIHRIRVANRLLQRQHRSRRNDPAPESAGNPPSAAPVNQPSNPTNGSTTSTSSSSSATASSISQHHAGRGDGEEVGEEPPSTVVNEVGVEEHSPAIIVGVSDPDDNRDDVQLLDDI